MIIKRLNRNKSRNKGRRCIVKRIIGLVLVGIRRIIKIRRRV